MLAILSERDSKNGKIKVPEIHVILASEFLGLKRSNQINWHKGWPSQLKDKLNLSGKTFRDQLKRLMGDDIYIENLKLLGGIILTINLQKKASPFPLTEEVLVL